MNSRALRALIATVVAGLVALGAVPALALSSDMTGTEQRVSIYGTSVASGDMNIRTDTAGSLKVHVASSSATGSSALQVQGTAASGSAAIGNPVLVGGQQSGSNGVQTLHVGPAGDLFVTLQASSSAIGTVTQGASTSLPWTSMLTNGSGVQQGTTAAPLAVIGQATGAIGAGNLAAVGVVNSAGAVVAPRAGLDNSLFVTVQASSSTIGAVTQGASGTLPWLTMLTNGSGVQQGTSAAPLRNDPTGTTTQPVSQAASGSLPWLAMLSNGSGVQQGTSTNPLAIVGQATGSIGSANLAAIGVVNASGNVVAPRAGLDNSLFVTLQASSSTIGNVGIVSGSAQIGQVAQGTATVSAGAWPVKLTDGTDTAQVDANGYLIISQGTASGSAWTVTGASTGSVGSSNGLLATGRDSAGNAQPFKLDTGGALQVDIESGPTGVSALQAQGAAASGSASAGNPVLVGGQQSGTNGVQTLHVGPAGDLFVTLQASSSAIGAVTQGASTSLPWNAMLTNGSGVQQGTSGAPLRVDPVGTTTQPVSGSVTVSGTVTANQGGAPWSVSSSGTFPVTQNASGSLPWLSMLSNGSGVQQGTAANPLGVIGTATGSVGSANGLLGAGRDSAGNAQPFRMATDGTLRVDPSGTTNQPVSQAASGTLPWLAMLSNGSGVQQGTTAAPLAVIGSATGSVGSANGLLATGRDSSGNVQPLRMATDGTLRIDPSGTTTQPVDSELPAAAALADTAANPTTPTVGAGTLIYNGATWDRARGDTTNGVDVDVTRSAGLQATIPTGLTRLALNNGSATQGPAIAAKRVTACSDDGAATNGNTSVVWVAGSDATASVGLPLRPGACYTAEVSNANKLYFWVAAASHFITLIVEQ